MSYYLESFDGITMPPYSQNPGGTDVGVGKVNSPAVQTVGGVYRSLGTAQALPELGRIVSFSGKFAPEERGTSWSKEDLYKLYSELAGRVGRYGHLTRITSAGDRHTILAELVEMPGQPRQNTRNQRHVLSFKLWEYAWRDVAMTTLGPFGLSSSGTLGINISDTGDAPITDPIFEFHVINQVSEIFVAGTTPQVASHDPHTGLSYTPMSPQDEYDFCLHWTGTFSGGGDRLLIDCGKRSVYRQSDNTSEYTGFDLTSTDANNIKHKLASPHWAWLNPAISNSSPTNLKINLTSSSTNVTIGYYKRHM